MRGSIERQFTWALGGLCLFYLLVQAVYIVRLPLVMDEFQGAFTVSHFGTGLPYRDFLPYKTVLGYYLQLVPMRLVDDPWTTLLAVKAAMAILTALVVFTSARLLRRHFRATAIILGTVLLVCMSTFLERSAELRVDMMTALAGLLSLTLLLDRRFASAGALAGLSFLVSQKGVYFLVAGALATGVHLLWTERTRASALETVRYGIGALAPIALYLLVWGAVSSMRLVVETVFLRHADIALLEIYSIRHYWFNSWFANPYFYSVAVLALGVVWRRHHTGQPSHRDGILLVYGAAVLALGLWHKQPWPYFLALVVPTLWVLTIAFFDAELERTQKVSRAFVVVLVLFGIVFPLRRVAAVIERDSGFQRDTVRVASAILEPGDMYLAGTEMIPNHRQPAAEHLGWIDRRHAQRLARIDPQPLLEVLESAPVKLVIANRRLRALPSPLRQHLAENFQWFRGAILIYAPQVESHVFDLKFHGLYELRSDGPVELDGRLVTSGGHISLEAGRHTASRTPLRLILVPEIPPGVADPRWAAPHELFDNPYDY